MMIEIATLADAEEILALQRLAYRSEAEIYGDYRIPPLMQSLDDIRDEFTCQLFLKVTLDGRINGSVRAFCEGGTCFIGRLIVHPDHRGKAVGTELMRRIERHYCDALRFELFTGHRSERNIRLYERLGYSICKKQQISDVLTLVFMEKRGRDRDVAPPAPAGDDMWDRRYGTEEFVYGKEPNGFLMQVSDVIPPGDILCLAEGEGRNAVFLARRGRQVVAVDRSAVGLAKAERLAAENGVRIETICADLAEFEPGEETWDAVVSIFCHVPAEVRRELHRKVVKGLRSGGMFILEAYTPAQLELKTGGPPVEVLLMTLAALREELAGLQFLHARELERDIVEGTLHSGRGAVVQVVARKP